MEVIDEVARLMNILVIIFSVCVGFWATVQYMKGDPNQKNEALTILEGIGIGILIIFLAPEVANFLQNSGIVGP